MDRFQREECICLWIIDSQPHTAHITPEQAEQSIAHVGEGQRSSIALNGSTNVMRYGMVCEVHRWNDPGLRSCACMNANAGCVSVPDALRYGGREERGGGEACGDVATRTGRSHRSERQPVSLWYTFVFLPFIVVSPCKISVTGSIPLSAVCCRASLA